MNKGLLLGLGRPNLGTKQLFEVVAVLEQQDDLLDVAEHTRPLWQDGAEVADCLVGR